MRDPVKRKAYLRARYLANKEASQAYYQANKELYAEHHLRWRLANRDRRLEQQKNARKRAKERSGDVYLSRAEILAEAERKRVERQRAKAARDATPRKPVEGTKTWLEAASVAEVAAYRQRCRDKYRAKYASDPIGERERSKTYKHANPDKVSRWQCERTAELARRDDGSLTRSVVGDLFGQAEGKRCPYCWHRMTGDQKSLDHIIPRADGGMHSTVNAVICCRPCNLSKGGRPFAEWLATLEASAAARALRLYRQRYRCDPDQASLPLPFAPAALAAA